MTGISNPIFSSGALLETEHGLVMLLLLFGLLTYRGSRLSKWVPVVIIGGISLSLFTPIHEMNLFWPVITGLVVPPFLWQGAVAVTKSGPLRRRWSLAVWTVTLILVTLSLRYFGGLPISNALLLGILAVTLVWYFREMNVERTYLSTVGLITLVILLVEIDLELQLASRLGLPGFTFTANSSRSNGRTPISSSGHMPLTLSDLPLAPRLLPQPWLPRWLSPPTDTALAYGTVGKISRCHPTSHSFSFSPRECGSPWDGRRTPFWIRSAYTAFSLRLVSSRSVF